MKYLFNIGATILCLLVLVSPSSFADSLACISGSNPTLVDLNELAGITLEAPIPDDPETGAEVVKEGPFWDWYCYSPSGIAVDPSSSPIVAQGRTMTYYASSNIPKTYHITFGVIAYYKKWSYADNSWVEYGYKVYDYEWLLVVGPLGEIVVDRRKSTNLNIDEEFYKVKPLEHVEVGEEFVFRNIRGNTNLSSSNMVSWELWDVDGIQTRIANGKAVIVEDSYDFHTHLLMII